MATHHQDLIPDFATLSIFDNKNFNVFSLLCDERQNRIGKIRVDDYQLLLRHAYELLHLFERIVDLPIEEYFLWRELLILHRVKN